MSGYNLPPGCTYADIDYAIGDDEPEPQIEEPEVPDGLAAMWDDADRIAEEDEMERARRRAPRTDELPTMLWEMAIGMNRAAAAVLRSEEVA